MLLKYVFLIKVELSNLETKLQSLEEDLELNANIVREASMALTFQKRFKVRLWTGFAA